MTSTSVPEPVTLATLDRNDLLMRVGGDSEILADILGIAPDNLRKLLDDLRDAIVHCDVDRVRAAAHTAKGALATLGAANARQAALQLENLARANDLGGAADELTILESRVADLLVELEKMRQDLD